MGGVGEGCVGKGYGEGVREADVACVFVGELVGEESEAEEPRRGVAGGGDLRDEGEEAVDLGHAEEEHGEDGEDGVGAANVAGDEDGAVVENQGCDEEDARFGEAEEEARVAGALESDSECFGRGACVFALQIAFEGEGADGADVAECFREDCVGRGGGVVASLFPVAGDGFKGAGEEVHERCA